MNNSYTEVYFYKYCRTRVHFDKAGFEEPCDECLSEPVNSYSHKPTKYVEKEKKQ